MFTQDAIPRSLPLWLICTSSRLRALAKPCRASAAAPAHRRSPRGTARRRTETEDEGVGALLYKGAPTGYTPSRAANSKEPKTIKEAVSPTTARVGVLESGTHRLSRRAASHAESWLPGRPGSRVAGNRGGERLKRGGGRGLAEWTLIVHTGCNSSVPASLANMYFFATESASQTMPC